MAKFNLTIDDTVPPQYRDQVPLWLETVIDFLISIPRPQSKSLPAIETLIPDFSKIKFKATDHMRRPYGLYHRRTWEGYTILPVKDHGHLIMETEPSYTLFENQDVALASMVCWVHLNDQKFLSYYNSEHHLARQIQFLEKFNPELHKRFIKERRAANTKAQMKAKRGRKPSGYVAPQPPIKPQYGTPPSFTPSVTTTTTTVAPPQPVPNETEAEVIERMRLMWANVGAAPTPCPVPTEPGTVEDYDL